LAANADHLVTEKAGKPEQQLRPRGRGEQRGASVQTIQYRWNPCCASGKGAVVMHEVVVSVQDFNALRLQVGDELAQRAEVKTWRLPERHDGDTGLVQAIDVERIGTEVAQANDPHGVTRAALMNG